VFGGHHRRLAGSLVSLGGPLLRAAAYCEIGSAIPASEISLNHNVHLPMPKAYWIAAYRSIHDPEALAAYAKLAAPALQKAGARILARGNPAQVYEGGLNQRTVLVEFDSVAQAVAAHDSPGYQEALRVLGNAVDRDLRIIEAID
jgi:uncharacterized protein (DUF1330 family)